MKKSEAINKLQIYINGLADCGIENVATAKEIIQFLEKEIGMSPPLDKGCIPLLDEWGAKIEEYPINFNWEPENE